MNCSCYLLETRLWMNSSVRRMTSLSSSICSYFLVFFECIVDFLAFFWQHLVVGSANGKPFQYIITL